MLQHRNKNGLEAAILECLEVLFVAVRGGRFSLQQIYGDLVDFEILQCRCDSVHVGSYVACNRLFCVIKALKWDTEVCYNKGPHL